VAITTLQTKIELIKNSIGIDSLINVDRNGVSNCPFCNKIKKWRTINNQYGWCYSTSCPSYRITIDTKRKSLDVIDIYRFIHSCTFSQAISELINNLDYEGHNSRIEERSKFLKQILYIYQQELWSSSSNKGINYLRQRGFSDSNIKCWDLGFASYGALLRSRGLKTIDLEKEGLYNPEYDKEFFSNRVVFPIRDNCSRIIHLQGRYVLPIPEDKKDIIPKYKATLSSLVPPITSFLFLEEKLNVYRTMRAPLAICEGAPDACSLYQIGMNSVGILGLSNLLKHTSKLKDFSEIIVIGDNDKFSIEHEYFPGEYKSWRMLIPQMIELQLSIPNTKVSLWKPSEVYGKDINDMLLFFVNNNLNPRDIKNIIINKAIDLIDYLIKEHQDDLSFHQTILTLISKTGRGRELFESNSLFKSISPLEYALKIFNF